MTTNNKEKIADLLINVYPDDNEKDYDITFKIVNNAFAPFHQVDYFLNGIFKDVNLMSEINSNGLKDDKKIQNRKNRIYTNGKIIHPIYKLNKKRIDKVVSDDNDNDNDDDQDGSEEVDYDDESDIYHDDETENDSQHEKEEPKKRVRFAKNNTVNAKSVGTIGYTGGKKNKKRKTKKHSKK